MKQHSRFIWMVVGLALVGAMHKAPAQTILSAATGSFDPAGSNSINAYAAGLGATDCTNWQTTVGAAFSGGTGGVWDGSQTSPASRPDSDASVGSEDNFSLVRISFGSAKLFEVSTSGGLRTVPYASSDELSGVRSIGTQSDSVTDWAMSFGLSGSGLSVNEQITSLGFGLLGRTGGVGTVTFNVTFNDLSTASLNSVPSAQGTQVFYQFEAPTGKWITDLAYHSTATRVQGIDDLSFTTSIVSVPEPSAWIWLGIACVGFVVKNRRQFLIGMKCPTGLAMGILTCVLGLMDPRPVTASLIAYDSFDQSAGALAGSFGTSVWPAGSQAWSGDGTVVSGSLSYDALDTSGNHAVLTGGGQAFRSLGTTIDGTTADIWISFLMVAPGDSIGISLFEGGSERNFMGMVGSQWGITSPSINLTTGQGTATRFVAVHLDGVNDLATVYLDPVLGGGSPSGGTSASAAYAGFSFDTIRLGGFSGWDATFDEFRMGTTWADVAPVPEPSTWWLFTLGAAGLVFLRRRVRHGPLQ